MDVSIPELIRLNIPFIFVLFLGFLSAVTAFWLYRRTVPQIKDHLRIILGILRALVVFMSVLLLFSPTLYLTYIREEPVKSGIFIDNSGSMHIRNQLEDRPEEVQRVVSALRSSLDTDQISWYVFNTSLTPLISDTIPASQSATNFGQIFEFLRQSDVHQAVLVSDGLITEGKHVFSETGFDNTTLHTVGVGSIQKRKDLFIADIIYSPNAYQDQREEIIVQIGNAGLSGINKVVKLVRDKKVIASKVVQIETPDAEQNVRFSVIPSEHGLQTYDIVLEETEGESNALNNKRTIAQRVLKSKVRIGIFAGSPSHESKFLAFLLNKNKDYEVISFVEDEQGNNLVKKSNPLQDSLDVLIFEGFPGRHTRPSTLNALTQLIQNEEPGIIHFLNKKTNFALATRLWQAVPFPFRNGNTIYREFTIKNPGSLNPHPILQIFDDPGLHDTFWSQVPPMEAMIELNKDQVGMSVIVMATRSNREIPLIMEYNSGNVKTLLFNGHAFWKWHFYLQNNETLSGGYERLLSNAVRLIAYQEKLRPLMIKSHKHVINLGEKIRISANMYDVANNPIRDGSLVLEAEWQDQRFELEVENDSSGNYFAEFWPPGAGKYRITGRARRNNVPVGTDQLDFEVIPYDKEYLKTRQNAAFLKQLASRMGGRYFTSDDMTRLAEALDVPPKRVRTDREVEIWYKPAMLLAIIFLITMEWIIRKRSGLV